MNYSNRRSSGIKITIMIVLLILVGLVALLILKGNKQILDFNNNFEYAYVCWPDGKVEKLKVSKWNDYEGDQIQIKTADGKYYLIHSSNCVLANE